MFSVLLCFFGNSYFITGADADSSTANDGNDGQPPFRALPRPQKVAKTAFTFGSIGCTTIWGWLAAAAGSQSACDPERALDTMFAGIGFEGRRSRGRDPLRATGWSKAMTLRLAGDDIEELRRALASAYAQVISELAQSSGIGFDPAGIQLCRRKWKLEGMLRRLDGPDDPPAVLQLIPRRHYAVPEQVAA